MQAASGMSAPASARTRFDPRRLAALFVKESHQVVRDPSSILIAFVLPAILLFLFGYAVSLDINRVRVAVVLEDDSPEAYSLASSFLGSSYFDVSIARDRRQVEEGLVSGELYGVIVVPQDFARRLLAAGRADSSDGVSGAPASVQVLTDGSQPNTAAFVQNYSQGAVTNWLQQRQLTRGAAMPADLAADTRVWYNPALHSRDFLVPGSIAVIMTITGTLLTALVVAREWERGTMEALMATPIGIFEILAGKLAPYFVLGMAAMTVCVIAAVQVFDVPLRGSIGALVAASAVFLLPALGQGLLISTLARNQFVAAQAAVISGFLPAFLLSGFIFDIASMPVPIQVVTHVVAARYFVTCLKTLFLVGDVWPLLLPNMAAMAAIGAVFLGITALRTKKRLD